MKGVCEFEPEVCWYRHELPSSQTITEFKCSLCGKIANSKPDLMKHRKIEHSEYVPSCLKDKSDACHFGKENAGTNMTIQKMSVKKFILNILSSRNLLLHKILGIL